MTHEPLAIQQEVVPRDITGGPYDRPVETIEAMTEVRALENFHEDTSPVSDIAISMAHREEGVSMKARAWANVVIPYLHTSPSLNDAVYKGTSRAQRGRLNKGG